MNLTGVEPIVIETKRLYLSELNHKITQHIFTELSDDDIKKYMGFPTEEMLEVEKNKFRKGLSTYFFSFKNFRIIEKMSGSVIGRCDYHTWVKQHRRAEIGYYLFQDEHKNKGYMAEALAPVLAFGFERMNLHRIEAMVASYNTPSLKLLQKFGFTQEGNLRGHYLIDGINEDSLVFSLLQPEFELKVKS